MSSSQGYSWRGFASLALIAHAARLTSSGLFAFRAGAAGPSWGATATPMSRVLSTELAEPLQRPLCFSAQIAQRLARAGARFGLTNREAVPARAGASGPRSESPGKS